MFIACRRRRNGSTPAVRGRQRSTASVILNHNWVSMRGLKITRAEQRILLVRRRRIHGVCTTCTAMLWNGARTGIVQITTAVLRLQIRKVPPAAPLACCGAGRDSTTRRSFVPRFATGSGPTTGTATSGFVSLVCWISVPVILFRTL